MHPQPSESPKVFLQQVQALFRDSTLGVNDFLSWAERAQGNADACTGEKAVVWYRNAVLIYDFLESKTGKPFISRIYMRLSIIGVYGYADERSRPYLEESMAWMTEGLPENIEMVKAEAGRWQKLPVERMRDLRMLKMKLKVAQQLRENDVSLDGRTVACLPLIPLLP